MLTQPLAKSRNILINEAENNTLWYVGDPHPCLMEKGKYLFSAIPLDYKCKILIKIAEAMETKVE